MSQSDGPSHAVAQTGGGCAGAGPQAIDRKPPQSRTAPVHPLSSSTSRVPQVYPSQVASRRVPWQSVVEPPFVHAAADRKLSGQSDAVRQHVPEEQQTPESQWPDSH